MVLDNMGESDLGRESAESTSITMTVLIVRDYISDNTKEIVNMDKTPGSTAIETPPSHCGHNNRWPQASDTQESHAPSQRILSAACDISWSTLGSKSPILSLPPVEATASLYSSVLFKV